MTSYFTAPEGKGVLGREPAAVLAAVQAVVALAVSFGLDLSGEQVGMIVAASAAILGAVTRSKVSPVGTVVDGHLPE